MNKLLGELPIDLDGKEYVMRPTFEGMLKMEELSGRTFGELVNVFMKFQAGWRDISAVIYGGMYGHAGNKPPALKFSEIGEFLVQEGYNQHVQDCLAFVSCIFSGRSLDMAVKAREERKQLQKKEQSPEQPQTEQPVSPV